MRQAGPRGRDRHPADREAPRERRVPPRTEEPHGSSSPLPRPRHPPARGPLPAPPAGRSSAAGLLVLLLAWLTIYTIEEGHVGIVKRFGKAISQVDPGIHLKIPFVDGIEKMEVRQRKNVEELAAATAGTLKAILLTPELELPVPRTVYTSLRSSLSADE